MNGDELRRQAEVAIQEILAHAEIDANGAEVTEAHLTATLSDGRVLDTTLKDGNG